MLGRATVATVRHVRRGMCHARPAWHPFARGREHTRAHLLTPARLDTRYCSETKYAFQTGMSITTPSSILSFPDVTVL